MSGSVGDEGVRWGRDGGVGEGLGEEVGNGGEGDGEVRDWWVFGVLLRGRKEVLGIR